MPFQDYKFKEKSRQIMKDEFSVLKNVIGSFTVLVFFIVNGQQKSYFLFLINESRHQLYIL